jgi:hypothetical protein
MRMGLIQTRPIPAPAQLPGARTCVLIKITLHFDPAPDRQDYAQPATRFALRWRFPDNQFHRYQTTGSGSASRLPLPPPLLQMAIQRYEAQTSAAAKLAPPHTVSQTRTLTPEPQLASAVSVLLPAVLRSFLHFSTDSTPPTGALLGQTNPRTQQALGLLGWVDSFKLR